MAFTFTRNPGVKVSVETSVNSLVAADNELVIVAKKAATGGSVAVGTPTYIDAYGDPVAAAAECITKFGTGSEIGEMVVAAIKGVLFSDSVNKVFPKIRVLPMVSTAVAGDLAAFLATQLTVPMPFVVVAYPATDATARGALRAHLIAISASDRGENAQFGSFGFMAIDGDTATATAAGIAGSSEVLCFPWLRDSAGTKANKVSDVAAAYAAVCASNGIPFNPLNGITVGGLVPPVAAADWHTSGDTGTVALGLDGGVSPLLVDVDGTVKVARTITTERTVTGVVDSAYYDMQDWQVLYYLRKNAFTLAQQPRYKRTKASVAKLLALKSELINICKTLESQDMLQHVDLFADQFTVERQPSNRHAAVYQIPVNVIPGFHNKGIGLVGTTQFDSVVA